jgi:hypothetical protein
MRRNSSVSSFKDDNDIEKERVLIFEEILQNGIPEVPDGWDKIHENQPDQSLEKASSRYSHRSLTSQ